MDGQRTTAGMRNEAQRLRLAHAQVGEAGYESLLAAEEYEARAFMQEQDEIVVVVTVTYPSGVLIGRVELSADDLTNPTWIGQQVMDELPSKLRPSAS